LTFVAGEDRSIAILLHDAATHNPIDLTGITVQLTLPREGGGHVKRDSGPLTIPMSAIVANHLYLPDHGLVSGDPVTFVGELPDPLMDSTTYFVSVVDLNRIGLTGPGGTPIVFGTTTAPGAGPFAMLNQVDLTLGTPILGQAMWHLRKEVSLAVNSGLSQTFYLGYSLDGSQRWTMLSGRLDVYPPVVELPQP